MAWSDYPHLYARIFGAPLAVSVVPLKAMVEGLRARVEHGSTQLEASTRKPSALTIVDHDRKAAVPSSVRVAVIPMRGALAHRGGMDAACNEIRGYDALSAELRGAIADDAIDGVLLDVDSPGGEVAGLPELAAEVMAARGKKPIFAVVNTIAASAAYWLAASADKVFVSPSGQVGSIGIVVLHVDQSAKDKADGLSYTFVHAGENKLDGHPHAPLADAAKAKVQERVDAIYGQFVDHVAKARGIDASAVLATKADVLGPDKAKAAGLVDAIGTYDEAMNALAAEVVARNGGVGMDAKAILAENEKLKIEQAQAQAKIAALELAQKTGAEAVAKAKAEAITAKVEALKKRAVPNAVSESDLTNVRALYEGGHDAMADRMGDLLVSGSGSTTQGGKLFSLAGGSPADSHKATVAHQANQLRAAGWHVETNAEGTEITKKTPPQKVGGR